MKVISKTQAMQDLCRKWRMAKKTIGFVPTMGALHEGHLELVKTSKKENQVTVVSIFVNPTQFGPSEDFLRYPRTLEKDKALLKPLEINAVFAPNKREMYPHGFSSQVKVSGKLVETLCGPLRPGHFDGVATVVVKLLEITQPTRLYLGQKDAQQAAVLKHVIKDLNIGVKPVICPTVREHDGLAMSSRNLNLTLNGRKTAPILYRALKVGKSIVDLGENDTSKVLKEIKKVILNEKKFKLQYLEAVESETLESLKHVKRGRTLVALAAYLDNVRLIDNILI